MLDVQAGDTVVIRSCSCKRLAKVDKVTPTQIVIGRARYSKSDGRQRGECSIMGRGYLGVPSAAEVTALEREGAIRNLTHKLGRVDWKTIPLNTLEQVDRLLNESGRT